ncbi:MAG: hypothetical protein LBE33_06095 [Zoogloeaceae bacterium]|jgi:hypothetical protein|nr:hypothetical protein [Zoogloeaceae bacterium]
MFRKIVTILAAFMASLALVGCATVVNDSNQTIKLETKTAEGSFVTGAECKMTNDYGAVTAKSGDTVQVHRSGKDLDVVCKHPENPDAVARAISRANGGMFGNIILGGGIGAIIDHNKGTAYTYPTWIRLIFGKTLVFDRGSENEGQPVLGTEPVDAQK